MLLTEDYDTNDYLFIIFVYNTFININHMKPFVLYLVCFDIQIFFFEFAYVTLLFFKG